METDRVNKVMRLAERNCYLSATKVVLLFIRLKIRLWKQLLLQLLDESNTCLTKTLNTYLTKALNTYLAKALNTCLTKTLFLPYFPNKTTSVANNDITIHPNLITLFHSITILLLLTACTEPIHIKTNDSPPVIVIYGELTDEFKSQAITVTRSSPYFDDAPNAGISSAEVLVRSSDGKVFRFLEHDSVKGLYFSENKFSARSGNRYDLSVTVDFNHDGVPDEYQASATILPAVVPDSLSLNPIEVFGHKNYILYAYFQDPPEENYYLFRVFQNDSLLTNQISKYIITDDALFNGQYVPGDLYFFNDSTEWAKDSEENRRRSAYLYSGDEVGVQISLISKGFYDFIAQCQKEKGGENPMFGGPASNITTNISNGGVGYFTGYCVKRTSIVF